jgi:hypothetical protein
MRLRVSPVTFTVLLALGCGALGCGAPREPVRRTESGSSGGAESTLSTEPTRSSDQLANDPAWESIPPDGSRRVTLSTEPDAGVAAPRCAGSCSAEGDACRDPRGWNCRRDWHQDQICGGAFRQLNPPELAWSCAPADPTTDRGDGCPFGEPAAGQACSAPASLACRYAPACGWSGVDAACVRGRWSVTEFHLPPPP